MSTSGIVLLRKLPVHFLFLNQLTLLQILDCMDVITVKV